MTLQLDWEDLCYQFAVLHYIQHFRQIAEANIQVLNESRLTSMDMNISLKKSGYKSHLLVIGYRADR